MDLGLFIQLLHFFWRTHSKAKFMSQIKWVWGWLILEFSGGQREHPNRFLSGRRFWRNTDSIVFEEWFAAWIHLHLYTFGIQFKSQSLWGPQGPWLCMLRPQLADVVLTVSCKGREGRDGVRQSWKKHCPFLPAVQVETQSVSLLAVCQSPLCILPW